MIPLNTPPGTQIICIESPRERLLSDGCKAPHQSALVVGRVYTFDGWHPHPLARECAMLAEVPYEQVASGRSGYHRRFFKLAVLPKCLTDLLASVDHRERAPA